jgi:hypothetical protein
MAVKSWIAACLWLSLGQTAPEVTITNQRAASIPVGLPAELRGNVRELLLFASTDQGRTWQQVASMPPTQDAFVFKAPIDGDYWLKVALINLQGQQQPQNIFEGPVQQKMIIDTLKPLLRLQAPQRQGDDVSLAWELQEDHPDWNSFRLEYQPKDGSSLVWTPIQATAGLTGQARFRPNTAAPLAIRLTFQDRAGNPSQATADLPGTGNVTTTGFNNPPATALPPNPMPPAPMFPGAETPLPTPPAANPITPNPAPPVLPGRVDVAAPPLPPLPATTAPQLPQLPTETKTFPMNAAPPPVVATPAPVVASPVSRDIGKVVATTEAPPPAPAVPAAPAAPNLTLAQPAPKPAPQLPALQYVNHTDVTLEYELARVGPSGVGSIDLWFTQNDGQSWERLAEDPEAKSGALGNGRHKRTIDLFGEGIYGFKLVVKSRAGLGQAPPKAGDAPEIRIEVDSTPPVAELYAPVPDPHKANTLLLRWSARDKNLTGTPVVLEWSAKREGPWQAIAAPLANISQHHWQLPDGLPVQVYLRLKVRDLAGNESVAVTPEPQLVDLSEPEGRLVNVSVSPR